jgi:hypothetical protein
MCQICEKIGHTAGRCWKRFDHDFNLEDKFANTASNSFVLSYGVDTNWYTDTRATNHTMSELDKLSMKEKYGGQEKI